MLLSRYDLLVKYLEAGKMTYLEQMQKILISHADIGH